MLEYSTHLIEVITFDKMEHIKMKATMKQKSHRIVISILAFFCVLILVPSTYAATVFLDDFEDGNANGWTVTASGVGTTGVELNNGSLRAYAKTSFLGARSLSQTFGYANNDILSFEMQVIANTGVEITFGGVRVHHVVVV